MTYKLFIFILIASCVTTIALATWKALGRQSHTYSYLGLGEGANGGVEPTFIGRLSWWAVPYPLFIALALIYIPEILRVIAWHEFQ